MLEWCMRSHAYGVAQRQGIDLRDIHFEFNKETGQTTVHVDAPNATQAQIEAFGQTVAEECPVARFRKSAAGQKHFTAGHPGSDGLPASDGDIRWKALPSSASSSSGHTYGQQRHGGYGPGSGGGGWGGVH